MLKMAKYTLKILWCLNHKMFKVRLAVSQQYTWKGYKNRSIFVK